MTASDVDLVSVITPCYNAAPFVAATIASVAAQTYPTIEHIVVDDGSTDESWDVVQRVVPEIRALRLSENRGGSHARNCGAALARGAYLLFLDADDLIGPNTVSALVAAVRERGVGAIAACRWQRLRQTEDGRWVEAPAEVPFPLPADTLRGWLERRWIPPCAILWRRDTYERSGGWDERITLNDDGDLMMRALVRGAYIVPATAGMALYRDHGTARLSLSQDVFSPKRMHSMWLVFENLTGELERAGKLDAYRQVVGRSYYSLALTCFQHGWTEMGRRCVQQGEALAGRCVVSRTWTGRLLIRLLGYERKERLVESLASLGLATSLRRERRALREAHTAGVGQSSSP